MLYDELHRRGMDAVGTGPITPESAENAARPRTVPAYQQGVSITDALHHRTGINRSHRRTTHTEDDYTVSDDDIADTLNNHRGLSR